MIEVRVVCGKADKRLFEDRFEKPIWNFKFSVCSNWALWPKKKSDLPEARLK